MADEQPFLSIIVPFHNSAEKCTPLLRRLGTLRPEDDVQIILVDDASTDRTLHLLQQFAKSAAVAPLIIARDRNGGPGAARNSGLECAAGTFVWFVDSDDDVDLKAIEIARSLELRGLDLIAWDWEHPTIRRRLSPGRHRLSAPAPPDLFDPIVANWLSNELLQNASLRFPENCICEATPIEAFVLPLLVNNYCAVDFRAYHANTSCKSVTRGQGSDDPRFYDRLATVSLGMGYLDVADLKREVRAVFEAAIVRLFLWYSIRLSPLPDKSWLMAARVMRKFRSKANRFGVNADPFDYYPGRQTSKLVARLLWAVSAMLPPQDLYFERLHMRAWGRGISWDPPTAIAE